MGLEVLEYEKDLEYAANELIKFMKLMEIRDFSLKIDFNNNTILLAVKSDVKTFLEETGFREHITYSNYVVVEKGMVVCKNRIVNLC